MSEKKKTICPVCLKHYCDTLGNKILVSHKFLKKIIDGKTFHTDHDKSNGQ